MGRTMATRSGRDEPGQLGVGAGETAALIARTAAQLFARKGYDATPVRAIVEAAGVTKPSLYYHFGSKKGLAEALLTNPMRDLVSRLREIAASPGDARRRLEDLFAAVFAFCLDDPDRSRFVYALFFGPLGSELAEELCGWAVQLDEQTLVVLQRAAEQGLIPPGRVHDVFRATRGLITISTMDYLYKGGELGPDLPRRLVDDLLRGFGQPGREESKP